MKKIQKSIGIIFFLLAICNLFAQSIFINEVMSSNNETIFDEDGDSPDWIEIFNADTTVISLGSFGLSDDVTDPFKWEGPEHFRSNSDLVLHLDIFELHDLQQ